jgi:cell division protein FtsB
MRDRDEPQPPDDAMTGGGPGEHDSGPGPMPDLAALPIIGVNRRRLAFIVGAVVTAWIVFAFARQVGDASAATARLETLQASNQQLAGRVAALRREYDTIQQPAWIAQQARGYRMGSGREVPFVIAGGAASLAPDAPGSAAVRLGAVADSPTPLDVWLSLLFGRIR